MKSRKNELSRITVAVCFICFSFLSCVSDDESGIVVSSQEYTAKLCLNVDKENFEDQKGKTRSASNEWEDGDKLYLIFTSGAKTVSGTAIYSMTDDWVLKYNGLLTRDQKTNVKVFYFSKVNSTDSDSLYFDGTCGIYRDEVGTYFFPSGSSEIRLTATLRPITGRLKIKGDSTCYYNLDGINYYSSFSLSSGDLSVTSEPMFDLHTQDYLYGFFESSSNRHIRVKNGDYLYSADCPSDFLRIGKSGFIDIPTPEAHNGWTEKLVEGWFDDGYNEEVKWVDLGLPSGLRWARDEDFNASDDNEELDRDEYSDCESYPWGATWFSSEGKTDKYSSKTKDISGTVDDPIWFYYEKRARMPKQSEFKELVDNLIWKNQYYKKKNGGAIYSGVGGYSKSNLTYIELYACGNTVWDFKNWTAEYEDEDCGFYWTSTPYSSDKTYKAYFYKFSEDHPTPELWYGGKALGMHMRPVIDK